MSQPLAARRALTNALMAMLEAFLAPLTPQRQGAIVGDHKAPNPVDGSNEIDKPYCVVQGVGGGWISGPDYGDLHADARWLVQVTSVGANREQAEWMDDAVRTAILGRTSGAYERAINPGDGQSVIRRDCESGGQADYVGTVVNVVSRYALTTTAG